MLVSKKLKITGLSILCLILLLFTSCSLFGNDKKLETVQFTIPEGYTNYQIAEELDSQNIISKEDFNNALMMDYSKSYDFLPKITNPAVKKENYLEGYLFPDTYEVYVGETGSSIVKRMLNNFLIKANDLILQAKEENKNFNDIVIIASMIEKETAMSNERPLVASVIYNRIEKHMKLQIDACIQYDRIVSGKGAKEMLSYSDLEIDTPYNTYMHFGLPAGPIANPALSAIQAALVPSATEYLYYVASEKLDGSHNFCSTYEEFEKCKEDYNQAHDNQNHSTDTHE